MIKKIPLSALIFICLVQGIYAQSGISQNTGSSKNRPVINEPAWVNTENNPSRSEEKYRTKWTKDPFDHQIFVENKGQFNKDIQTTGKILYQAMLGKVKAYFTSSGVFFRYDEYQKKGKKEDVGAHGEVENSTAAVHYASYSWSGANKGVVVDAKEEQTYCYVYPTGDKSSIQVNIFKKIVYHNIYPGIDIEYSFSEGKPGIKYSLIVHPGADISLVKLVYSGSKKMYLNSNGDAIVQSDIGEITDHAPVSFYQNSGQHIKSSYKLINGNTETFSVGAIAGTNDDLVIDPWSTDPNFTAAYDAAYDVDYDQLGNVYAYGSYNPFQLTKFNAAGTQQWTYNATTINGSNYGDFAVDKVTGTSYVTEGAVNAGGAKALKVNTLGVLTGTFPGTAGMLEMWRVVYNSCTRQLVIGGGGGNTPTSQACILDTSMAGLTPVNPLGTANCCHDVCLIAMDPNGGTAWMALAENFLDPAFNNYIMSLPVPALTPYNYAVPDHFAFQEIGSLNYGAPNDGGVTNGMNGMAASNNWLYIYNGDTLKQLVKGSGTINAVKKITNSPYSWGGLDVDACDNVYLGENSSIQVYNSALALTSTLPVQKGTVYDVVLGTNYTKVYAGGQGFVSSTDIVNNSITVTNAITPATCAGCDGSATPTVKVCGAAPGTTPTYLWSPGGQTTQTATALCKGSYTVTISLGGCGSIPFTDTLTVTQGAPGSLSLTKGQTNITCNGSANGVASVAVTGGSGAGTYTYSWAPSGGTSSATTPLGPGTYTVTVNDAACDKDTAIFTITQPPVLRDSISAINPIKCFASTGTLTVGVKGGTGPYSFSWTPSGGTSATTTPLSTGTYTVNITDHNGCPATANGSLIQPSQIRDSIVTSAPPTCKANVGTATIGVKNGSPGYSYLWNSTPTQTNATATNLPSGTFTCVVTDNNGCKDSASITLTAPGAPRDSVVSTSNISCFGGANGSISIGVNRGTPAYIFAWSNGKTTQNIGGLTAGTYSVLVTDQNGCKDSAKATIAQPTQVRDSIVDSVNVLCFGQSNGSATVGAKNGSPGYTYSWNTVPIQTNATATGLKQGNYICTVKDNNGCASIVNVAISQPNPLTIKSAAFPVNCNGACDGSAAVIPAGGTTPYSYLWSNNSTNPSISNLCPNTYSIVVTDNNGCTVDSTGLIVTQPTAITITTNVIINSHCGQTDGSCSITVTGGTPGVSGYTYLWSDGTTNQNLSKAIPGKYCVKVTDGNGCKDSTCVTINDVASPVVIITAFTNEKCNGDSSGTATATATGGSSPYKYSWSTNPIQTNSVATGLKAGSYTITVTDSGGCVSTAVATITQPALVVTSTSLPPTICIGQSATINATSVGGTPPYTYTWSTGATGSSITVSPLVTTTYTVTSTLDSNNCKGAPVTVVVTVDPPLTVKVTATPDTVCLGNNATLTATATGGNGNYTFTWQPGNLTGSPVVVTPTVNTVYTVTLSDGCTTPNVKDSISVVIDPSPVVNFTADTLSGCYPLCVTFINKSTVAGGAITSEEWTFGNGVKSNKDTANYCYGTAGVYSVGLTVTTNIGCPDSVTKPNYITVYAHPTAAFTTSPAQISTLDPTVYFTNESTDAYGIKKYFWQFDDMPFDITDTAKNPSHTYHDSGWFCPELWVTNIHGCVDSVTECVDITPYFTFFIPNAFSPNGDGKNDVFAPKGDFVCSFQMYIFDRWGMMLYYTEDMNHGWDGTVDGGTQEAQEDTYVYLITVYDCPQEKKHTYLGKVSIVK